MLGEVFEWAPKKGFLRGGSRGEPVWIYSIAVTVPQKPVIDYRRTMRQTFLSEVFEWAPKKGFLRGGSRGEPVWIYSIAVTVPQKPVIDYRRTMRQTFLSHFKLSLIYLALFTYIMDVYSSEMVNF